MIAQPPAKTELEQLQGWHRYIRSVGNDWLTQLEACPSDRVARSAFSRWSNLERVACQSVFTVGGMDAVEAVRRDVPTTW